MHKNRVKESEMLRPLLWYIAAFWPLLDWSFIFSFIVCALCPTVNKVEMSGKQSATETFVNVNKTWPAYSLPRV